MCSGVKSPLIPSSPPMWQRSEFCKIKKCKNFEKGDKTKVQNVVGSQPLNPSLNGGFVKPSVWSGLQNHHIGVSGGFTLVVLWNPASRDHFIECIYKTTISRVDFLKPPLFSEWNNLYSGGFIKAPSQDHFTIPLSWALSHGSFDKTTPLEGHFVKPWCIVILFNSVNCRKMVLVQNFKTYTFSIK